jgi:hypothetical protein
LLVIVLLVVKLFRPKRLPDFWVIQTIGLMMVTLGCVLAGEAEFGLLLIAYLGGLLWCLALFHLQRELRLPAAESHAGLALFTSPERLSLPPTGLPWRYFGAGRVGAWLILVVLAGGLLFLFTPRHGNMHWVPQQLTTTSGQMRTGVDSGMDLNRVGEVELSADPAFHVVATDAAGARHALPADQLWRVEVYDFYLRGHWLTWTQAQELSRLVGPRLATIVPEPTPPDASSSVQFRFTLKPMNAGGLVLAEPMNLRRAGLDAALGENKARVAIFQEVPGGDALVPYVPVRKNLYRYSQIIEASRAADRVPASRVSDAYHAYLTSQAPPEAIKIWLIELMGNLSELSADERRLDDAGHVAPEHHARVATALSSYLARSHEYAYSLTLRRSDRALDPTADFLLNVKQGHCERFAGGLTLMLRSVGIPARIVKGYRGADPDEEGSYTVRQDQAHSWVQVLLKTGDTREWLVLDPTPGNEAGDDLFSLVAWVGSLDPQRIWKRLVMDYNTEVQARAWELAQESFTWNSRATMLLWGAVGLGAATALLWAAWSYRIVLGRWLPRARAHSELLQARAAFALYSQLLRLLAQRLELTPDRGQTPREFAHTAGERLPGAGAAAFTPLPARIAEALYRVRYGGEDLSTADEAELRQQLAALQDTLGRHPAEKRPHV